MFRRFSEAAGLNPSDSGKVSEYIIATKGHNASASDDQDLRAFIDLDMAVVGRGRAAYLSYASQVRMGENAPRQSWQRSSSSLKACSLLLISRIV